MFSFLFKKKKQDTEDKLEKTEYSESEFIQFTKNRNEAKYKYLFQEPFVNFDGKTKDTDRDFSDIVAELIENGKIKFALNPVDKNAEIKIDTPFHSKTDKTDYASYTNGKFIGPEEKIAGRLFETSCTAEIFGEMCEVCDYAVPVNNNGKENLDGKIDVVFSSKGFHVPDFLNTDDKSFLESEDPFCQYIAWIYGNLNKYPKSLVISSVKYSGNNDSLLKCILEIETFYRRIPHDRLKNCYHREWIKKAILIFDDSRAYSEYLSFGFNSVKKLLEKWEIAVLTLKEAYLDCEPQKNEYSINSISHIYRAYKKNKLEITL